MLTARNATSRLVVLILALHVIGCGADNPPDRASRHAQSNESATDLPDAESPEHPEELPLLESSEEVMRVTFRSADGKPFRLAQGEEALLRGVSYSSYEDAQWYRAGNPQSRDGVTSLEQRDTTSSNTEFVIQEIEIQPDNHRFLFGVYPVYEGPEDDQASRDVLWDPRCRAMVRHWRSSEVLSYCTWTTGIKDRRMLDMVDILPEDNPTESELTEFPSSLIRVKQLADEVIAATPTNKRNNTIARARVLTSYLRDSGDFVFTLAPPSRDPDIDPIEDFVSNNRRGHCEYFATALTLMLRSQGIPARMVNGYKCGEWNSLGQFYQVRQLHAHVWVEVRVKDPNPDKDGMKWLILDPTPMIGD